MTQKIQSRFENVAEFRKIIALSLSFLLISFTISTASVLGQTYNIGYDQNGNRQSAFGYYYEYNNFNQLVKVRQSNSTGPVIEEYAYDDQGQRAIKQEPQKNQTTYYISREFIRVVNSSGTFDTIYYYDKDTLVGREEFDGKKFFYHPDHLGSTTLITNESGAVVEETTYEPFGNVFSGGNDRFLYTGKERDQGTGLEYYGARYYDPNYAQFTQPDSNLPNPYDPQALNRYSYTLNNPYKYTDPTGNFGTLVTGGIGAAAGAIWGFTTYIGYQLGVGARTGNLQINWVDAGKSTAVGTAAGGVFGLTLGAGTAIATVAGVAGPGATIVSGSTAGVLAGQSKTLTSNIVENRDITQGLGNPSDINIDALLGGTLSFVELISGQPVQDIFGNILEDALSKKENEFDIPSSQLDSYINTLNNLDIKENQIKIIEGYFKSGTSSSFEEYARNYLSGEQ